MDRIRYKYDESTEILVIYENDNVWNLSFELDENELHIDLYKNKYNNGELIPLAGHGLRYVNNISGKDINSVKTLVKIIIMEDFISSHIGISDVDVYNKDIQDFLKNIFSYLS